MEKEKKLIGECDKGSRGTPGQSYGTTRARVYALPSGRFELTLLDAWGSNQGYLEEHGRNERRYRADSLSELLRVGVAEVRQDDELKGSVDKLVAAIREAIFDAEDAD